MSVPHKLFSRLTTSLVAFRTNPCEETDKTLLADEIECGWPGNGSHEQFLEWADICERTRVEFESKVDLLHNYAPNTGLQATWLPPEPEGVE